MAITPPANMLLPREYILECLEEDLGAIDGTGDYHTKLIKVTRQFIPWNKAGVEIPMLIVTDGSDIILEEAGQNIQREMTAIVWGYVKPDEEVNTSRDLNYLLEDVFRCLKADKQRDELALWTRFGRIDTDEGWLTPFGVFKLEVLVSYLYLDPQT